jgi:hypothetical protein
MTTQEKLVNVYDEHGIYRSATPQLIVKHTLTRCLNF